MNTIEQFAVEHRYYCSSLNYFSSETHLTFATLAEFLDEFESADIDYNLCWRWDIRPNDEDEEGNPVEGYYAEIFLMLQRQGIFMPIRVNAVLIEHLSRFQAYLQKHWEYLHNMWQPIAQITNTTSEQS